MPLPLIGITCDFENGRYNISPNYVDRVREAGGLPLLIPPLGGGPEDVLDRFDGIVLSGGDDLHMDAFGVEQHEKSVKMDRRRQVGELALVRSILHRPELPVLGVCLGMQLMGLVMGAELEQHLPDVMENAAVHEDNNVHEVRSTLGNGMVTSRHHQALRTPGRTRIIGEAPDGVLEAIQVPDADWQVGVQWHPERTVEATLGQNLFIELVARAKARMR